MRTSYLKITLFLLLTWYGKSHFYFLDCMAALCFPTWEQVSFRLASVSVEAACAAKLSIICCHDHLMQNLSATPHGKLILTRIERWCQEEPCRFSQPSQEESDVTLPHHLEFPIWLNNETVKGWKGKSNVLFGFILVVRNCSLDDLFLICVD